MLLYLVRHGRTDYNNLGLVQGTTDIPLNAEGRQQARQLADHLRLVPFRQAWSSDLKRAEETARIILENRPQCALNLDARLRDQHLAEAQGHPYWAVEPKTGESLEQVEKRVAAWLASLIETHTPAASPAGTPRTPTSPTDPGSGTVLAVTHDICLVKLLSLLRAGGDGMPDIHVPSDIDGSVKPKNTAVAIVRVWWEEGSSYNEPLACRGRLEAWGTTDHLDDI